MDDIRNIYKEEEYKILFKEFYPSLVQFAFHYINNHETAEDIVQEIFVYLWEKQIHFENELIEPIYTVLFAINVLLISEILKFNNITKEKSRITGKNKKNLSY